MKGIASAPKIAVHKEVIGFRMDGKTRTKITLNHPKRIRLLGFTQPATPSATAGDASVTEPPPPPNIPGNILQLQVITRIMTKTKNKISAAANRQAGMRENLFNLIIIWCPPTP